MRITLERSGGVAGMIRRQEVDTSTLPADTAKRLTTLAAGLGAPPKAGGGADRFMYALTIEDGGKAKAYTLSEADMPAEWRTFLDEVRKAIG